MTRSTNARIAGATLLFYIAAGLTSMAVFGRASAGDGVAARLATIAQHPVEVGIVVLLGLVQCFAALVLGVTLWAITRDEDQDVAMVGLVCRVGEGLVGAVSIPGTLALLDLAASPAANVLGGYLLRTDVGLPGTLFAVGSTCFSWLLLRGRMIPVPLAWLGVVASLLLVGGLPLMLAGFLRGPLTGLIWLPMLAFEVPLALWLVLKGAVAPARR